MRIIAGLYAGRDLTSPSDFRVRPTAEHVRAALLDALASELPGARVLDLFAGTGALGLEALSRGARTADFVEFRPASLHALKANIVSLKVRQRTRLFKRDAVGFASVLPANSYDITFADPPYGSRVLDRTIEIWKERRFSRLLAVEHQQDHPLPGGKYRKTFADSAITIYQLKGATR